MATYNHTGQVVTDLERSKRFYQEVFGFQVLVRDPTRPTKQPPSSIACQPPLGVTASYLVLDGFVLELMHYSAPGAAAPSGRAR